MLPDCPNRLAGAVSDTQTQREGGVNTKEGSRGHAHTETARTRSAFGVIEGERAATRLDH